MTTEQPNVTPGGRYPILKAAQMLGMSRNTLKAWIKKEYIRPGEYNIARYGHRGVFLFGRTILRVWNASAIEKKNNKKNIQQ